MDYFSRHLTKYEGCHCIKKEAGTFVPASFLYDYLSNQSAPKGGPEATSRIMLR
ncbi:MAG: hypothetical protein L0K82_04735 [Pisciglobus halotolerans]|nr:hypothetical protein [Pisciglobus halotolerans]